MGDRSRATAGATPPLLRLRSHYEPLMVLVRHPVRLVSCLLLLFFLMPEFLKLAAYLFDIKGQAAHFAVVASILGIVFLPEMLAAAVNCRHITYDFFEDELCFKESFLLQDQMRIPYRMVADVQLRSGLFQRVLGLCDIVMVTENAPGRQRNRQILYYVPDIRMRDGKAVLARIRKIVFTQRDILAAESRAKAAAATTPSG